MSSETPLSDRLHEHADFLLDRVRRSAPRALLAMESAEDLVQEVNAHVLTKASRYAEQDGSTFEAWLGRVATNVVRDRHDYFRALKRDGARVLRFALTATEVEPELDAIRDLAASVTGPSTFAARREQLGLAARALDSLLVRDRWLIDGICTGRELSADAERLGVELESARQARSRALKRLRRAFRIVAQGLDSDRD